MKYLYSIIRLYVYCINDIFKGTCNFYMLSNLSQLNEVYSSRDTYNISREQYLRYALSEYNTHFSWAVAQI